ncbi:MAG: 1-acyl-sn-glycerol-3-phosphate acyltransferase [Eubacterium sp.]|nr:1-acyl-sn-glycerol-3-phosphate acyltransferase [Eubacterium sp.]
MLRSIAAIFLAIFYLVSTLPVLVYLLLFCRKDPEKQVRIAKPMIQWVFRAFMKIAGTKLTVIGKENIPADQAVLFVSNHRSIFDVVSVYTLLDIPVSFVSKKSLRKIPLFRNWFDFLGTLYFDRDDLKDGIRMLKDAINLVKNGTSVYIFPEGTRRKEEKELPLLPFHEGSFRISTKSGCPVIPIAIHNSMNVFERQFPRLVPTNLRIEFGEPIDPSSLTKQEQRKMGELASGKITAVLEKCADE